jgi:hypothetical protein
MTIKVTTKGWTNPNFVVRDDDVTLISPSGLTGRFTDFANQVEEWCADRDIEAHLISKHTDVFNHSDDISTWRIENEAHRTLFILRWS